MPLDLCKVSEIQYCIKAYPMDRGAWQTTGHGVMKSWTRLSNSNNNNE